ncbi:hypothetical protein MAJ_09277, partial [Metarhizium majus ARSEF 297]
MNPSSFAPSSSRVDNVVNSPQPNNIKHEPANSVSSNSNQHWQQHNTGQQSRFAPDNLDPQRDNIDQEQVWQPQKEGVYHPRGIDDAAKDSKREDWDEPSRQAVFNAVFPEHQGAPAYDADDKGCNEDGRAPAVAVGGGPGCLTCVLERKDDKNGGGNGEESSRAVQLFP